MSFLGQASLHNLLNGTKVIDPFVPSNIKNGAYELTLGDEVFQTDAKPRAVKALTGHQQVFIEPGQFALLLTQETIQVPGDKIGFISIKAGVKFEGLVNVSGFHVDPGYEGKLLFSVYNAGPSTIVLSRGSRYFPLWFADIDNVQNYQGKHQGMTRIPDRPIKALSQGELASPNALSKRIDDVKGLLTKIEWVCIAIVALLTGITAKIYTDSAKLKEAVEFGRQTKTMEIAADSNMRTTFNAVRTLQERVDSLSIEFSKLRIQTNAQ